MVAKLKIYIQKCYFVGNSEESTMMMEQSIWCENSSSPTLQVDMLSDETY